MRKAILKKKLSFSIPLFDKALRFQEWNLAGSDRFEVLEFTKTIRYFRDYEISLERG